MGIDLATLALFFSVFGVLWGVYRDRKLDGDGLNLRINKIESDYRVLFSNVKTLGDEQEKTKTTLKNLETSINSLNIKMERVLTILEKK
ncbi:hypothetical protein H0I54_11670 [Yersinia kristensenii]|uniref:hypothetical protein n=1 Tax=Yersinia kristensenii TaxID=28152 RepID=UPI0015628F9A|nr:hypothetical protein [Yersinia kristensenii]MBW5842471.1 hypothetical protein [Yersinia kristensenii]QKJ15585.1 hypothetical protein HRD70_10565 [Yersinia kristensenii]